MAVLVLWGTLYQTHAGLHAARERFFGAWFVLAFGVIPFPGVKTMVLALLLNVVFAVPVRLGFRVRRLGLILIHAGIALLMLGAALTHYLAREAPLILYEGQSASRAVVFPEGEAGEVFDSSEVEFIPLPLTVRLVDFTKLDYHGTDKARDYQSRLHVQGDDIDREVVVSLNKPFRYGEYTFYQFSYLQEGAYESTSLVVVRNPGRCVPYVASIIITVGLLFHALMKLVGAIRSRGRAEV